MKRLFIKSVLATVALAACGLASAQDIKERTIKFGHLNNADHPVSMGVKRFAELLAAKSGGKLTVRERVEALLDKHSFRELGSTSGWGRYDAQGQLEDLTPSNQVAGHGRIDG